MHRFVFSLLLAMFVLMGCAPSTAEPPQLTEGPAQPSTLVPESSPTSQPTPTPATILPQVPITTENVTQLAVRERLGKGAVLNMWALPAVGTMLVHTTDTLSLFSEDMQLITELPVPTAFTLSPTGTLLAEIGANGQLALRSLANFEIVRIIAAVENRGHLRLRFSPDETLLALSNYAWPDTRVEDHVLLVYDTQTAELVATLAQGEYAPVPVDVFFSPDNKYVITGSTAQIAIWDFEKRALLHRAQPRSYFPEQPFHLPTHHFVSERDGILYIWDPIEGKPIYEYGTELERVVTIDWSEDYEYININNGEQVRNYLRGAFATSFQSARYLYPPVYPRSVLHNPDFAAQLAQLSALGYSSIPEAGWLHASLPEQAWLLLGEANGAILPGPGGEPQRLSVWQPDAALFEVFDQTLDEPVLVQPEQDVALTCVDAAVIVYTLSSGMGHAFGRCDADTTMAVSQDGSQLAKGNFVIELYDLASGGLLGTLRAHEYALEQLLFSRDGRLISLGQAYTPVLITDTGSYGGYWVGAEIFIWSLQEPLQRISSLSGAAAQLSQMTLSPDEHYLAAVEGERLRIWELESGRQLNSIVNPVVITSVAWAPSGDFVVLGGDEGSLHFWDWRERTLLYSVQLHELPETELFSIDRVLYPLWRTRTTFPVLDVVFSPDGATVQALSADGHLTTFAIP